MGRRLARLAALVLATAAAPPAAAQRVSLAVSTTEPVNPTGAREPRLQLRNLLQDAKWLEMLQSSLPIRLHYRVELWRVRSDWFDALERAYEWQYLIQAEPLTDEYSSTRFDARGASELPRRFSTLRDLDTATVSATQQIRIRPTVPGQYYFVATVQIRTLTDQEMTELERFLQGEAVPRDADPERRSAIGAAFRRWILRVGGLPRENLEAKTGRFMVTER